MKKKILITIILILIGTGLITSYLDSAKVRNGIEPKYVIKIVSKDGNKVTYWGIGYKIIRYPSMSPNEPYKNSRGVKYGSWFMKYEIDEQNESTYKTTELENVNISISDISLSSATITIKDTNTTPYTYGEWYKIEKLENGKWYEIKTINDDYGFNEMGYLPDKNNEVKFVMNWESLYGNLEPGTYRILKQVNNLYISIEFSIATTSKKIEVIKPEVHNLNKFNTYLKKDNKIIYLKGNIEEIYYTESGTRMTLKDYITKSYQTTDDAIKNITDMMEVEGQLNDGGTIIYKLQESDITIINCKTLSGNRNIYIGDYLMEFDSYSMCK